MSLHRLTKAQRKELAIKSRKILKEDPTVHVTGLAHRLGLKTGSHLYTIWREFGYPSLRDLSGRK